MLRVAAAIVLSAIAAACAARGTANSDPSTTAELWREPIDVAQRDLLYGPGGIALVPDTSSPFAQLGADTKGFSPGYDVRDAHGREWSVKVGPEARTEVVVSRLVWAAGYRQPDIYYVPNWTLAHDGRVSSPGPARFRHKDRERPRAGEWSWRDNPFRGTRPLAGLFVLMVMVNNWDLRTAQNVIYRVDVEGSPRHWFVVKDLGASLGRTNWFVPGKRDDIDAFEREGFVDRVEGNRVTFHYRGAWLEPHLAASITPGDVVWVCELLSRLSDAQWMDAFRAGGYPDAIAVRYVRRLKHKVDEGLKLAPAP